MVMTPAAAPSQTQGTDVGTSRHRCQRKRNSVVANIETPCTIELSTVRYQIRNEVPHNPSVDRHASPLEKYLRNTR